MNQAFHIGELERFAKALPALLDGIDARDARFKLPGGGWSILEIVRHLGDEEVEDFRTRLRLTLESPETQWPPIDPEGCAIARDYNQGDLPAALAVFLRERAESIRWLRSLGAIDAARTHVHPKFGAISAGDLLASWAAHDALHLRQIAKRLHELAALHGAPFDTRYAGEWRA